MDRFVTLQHPDGLLNLEPLPFSTYEKKGGRSRQDQPRECVPPNPPCPSGTSGVKLCWIYHVGRSKRMRIGRKHCACGFERPLMKLKTSDCVSH